MIHIGLFEGIGGFSLASRWMGWKTYVTCEINPFGQRVLKYHFPKAYHHSDIHNLDYETINIELTRRFGAGWRNDDIILTGGFPCQPFSTAGKRKGTEDERYLWPEMLRAIQEIQPKYIVGENVPGLVNWDGGLVFEQVQTDLENEGYKVLPFILPAASVNAPHKRERIWFVAHADSHGGQTNTEREQGENKKNTKQSERLYNSCTSSDSDGIRFQRSKCKYEINADETRFNAQHDTEQNAIGPDAANTKSQQSEWSGFEQRETGQQKQGKSGGNSGKMGYRGNTTNTNNERLQGEQISGSTGGIRQDTDELTPRFFRTDWKIFPTQSPVCDGDDGLSTQLDSITFSKWRQESVKAGGNAIVPQVAFQIFKAIEQFRNLKQ